MLSRNEIIAKIKNEEGFSGEEIGCRGFSIMVCKKNNPLTGYPITDAKGYIYKMYQVGEPIYEGDLFGAADLVEREMHKWHRQVEEWKNNPQKYPGFRG